MIIYPAIDLRQGRCVRLRQGNPAEETVFGDDPASMARFWAEQGAEWLHVVNLDGAFNASQLDTLQDPELAALPINLRRLQEIRHAVKIPIQFGGGLRTLDDIQLALQLGADRVVLGTVAIENPTLVSTALLRWGADRIVVGIDARDGKVATHGWQSTSRVDAIDLGHQMQAQGVRRVVYTDISRDGMLSGVNLPMTTRMGDLTGLKVIASGGVASLADIEALKTHEHYNIDGVITGQAIYTGTLNLAAAIQVGHQTLRLCSAGLIPFRIEAGNAEFLLLYNLFFEQWQFPRGGSHHNEGEIACARREFSEEAGLPVRKVFKNCRSELNYTTSIRGYEIERTVVYYLAEIGPGEIRLGDENHCEARWVSAQEAWELLAETGPEQLPALDTALAFLHPPRL